MLLLGPCISPVGIPGAFQNDKHLTGYLEQLSAGVPGNLSIESQIHLLKNGVWAPIVRTLSGWSLDIEIRYAFLNCPSVIRLCRGIGVHLSSGGRTLSREAIKLRRFPSQLFDHSVMLATVAESSDKLTSSAELALALSLAMFEKSEKSSSVLS